NNPAYGIAPRYEIWCSSTEYADATVDERSGKQSPSFFERSRGASTAEQQRRSAASESAAFQSANGARTPESYELECSTADRTRPAGRELFAVKFDGLGKKPGKPGFQ